MKFLHTSDWHLGARLGDYSRLEEQRAVLEQIRKAAESEAADFIIIAGDIFDNFNPPNEAVELLYRELKKLSDNGSRPVIAIAGNHDSPDRIEAPDPLAAECGIFFVGYPDFTRPAVSLEGGPDVGFPEQGIVTIDFPGKPQVRILTTPYANENRLRKQLEPENREEQISEILGRRWKALADKYCDDAGINILTAHLFMTAAALQAEPAALAEPDEERSILHPGGLEMIDASLVPPQVRYTALGHLHRPQSVRKGDSPVVYAGSPLAFGLSEENQQKSVTAVELEPGKAPAVKRVNISGGRRILRKRFAGIDEAVGWLTAGPECYVELLIECENYISAGDRKRLFDAHDGITAVIPVSIGGASGEEAEARSTPDLTESMEDLFISFFKYTKGSEPDEALLELFREVTAATDGETADGETAEGEGGSCEA